MEHRPARRNRVAVHICDSDFRCAVQIGVALLIVFGQPGQHTFPIGFPGDLPGVYSIRCLHRLIACTIFGTATLQFEGHRGILGTLLIRKAFPTLDQLVLPLSGDGVGLPVLEFLHTVREDCLSAEFGSRGILVLRQGEASLSRGLHVRIGHIDLLAVLIQHFDFLDNRLCHVIGMTVFIIDVDIELQIQGGDVLRKAGQGLGRRLFSAAQLFKGVQPGGIHRKLLIFPLPIGSENRHLYGSAFNIRQVGGALPDLGDLNRRLFPAHVGNGAAIRGALVVSAGVYRFIIIGIHGLTDEIDISPPMLIKGRQLKIFRQRGNGTFIEDNILFRSLAQLVGKQNVLVNRISIFIDFSGCLPVNDLGGVVFLIHGVNAVLVVRNRVAPQRHRGGRALLCRGIVVLPNFRSVELRLDRNVLFNGSAIVAQGDIITIVPGAIVVVGFVRGNRHLRDGAVRVNASLYQNIVVFLILFVIAGQILSRYAPCIRRIAAGCHLQVLRHILVTLVPDPAVQPQRHIVLVGAMIFPVVAIDPADRGLEFEEFPEGESIAGLIDRHGIVLHSLWLKLVAHRFSILVHAGQAAVDIFPQRRLGYVQARQIVDAQLFPGIRCQLFPLAVPGFI